MSRHGSILKGIVAEVLNTPAETPSQEVHHEACEQEPTLAEKQMKGERVVATEPVVQPDPSTAAIHHQRHMENVGADVHVDDTDEASTPEETERLWTNEEGEPSVSPNDADVASEHEDYHEEYRDEHVVDPYEDGDVESAQQVAVALEWLRDLHGSVRRYGVSQHDLHALNDIRSSLEGHGIEMDVAPALEHYPVGSFMPERSSVNMDVAVEGIAQTMVRTIRQWIRQLIDYIQKMLKWALRHVGNEAALQNAFDRKIKAIEKVRKNSQDLEQLFTPSNDVGVKLTKYHKQLLEGKVWDGSTIELAAFGEPSADQQVGEVSRTLHRRAPDLQKTIDALGIFLADETQGQLDISTQTLTVIAQCADQASSLQAASPTVNHTAKTVGDQVLSQPIPQRLRQVEPYDYLWDVYRQMEKALKRMNRLNNDADIDGLSTVLSSLTRGVDHVYQLGTMLMRFNKKREKVLAAIYNYEKQRFTWLWMDAYHTANDGSTTDKLNAIKAALVKDINETLA